MRSIVLCCLGICLTGLCTAQKQGNVWLFGHKAGLNFNTSPPTIITGATGGVGLPMQEGTSSISDSSGRLLFYSDGEYIYNRRDTIMVNGSSIGGHRSSTQSSIIIPKPGTDYDNLFYVFTSDAQESYLTSPLGYNYSVVNMCLGVKNPDTLGAVVAAQKNINLVDSGTEKLCAASDGLGGYWVLGHKVLSNSFIAWHLTASGLSAPVISSIGPTTGALPGQMKFNVAGSKVAAVNSYNAGTPATLDLFDFNLLTGKLSNHCQNILSPVTATTSNGAYGVEFSPDGSRVYVTYSMGVGGVLNSYLIRYTVSGNCASVGNSRDTLFRRARNGHALTGIQAAPDGKLYVGYDDFTFGKDELHRINNPNGSATYDTAAFTFPYYAAIATMPPSFVAGFKYQNKLCKCPPPASITATLLADIIQVNPNPTDGFVSFAAQGTQNLTGLSLVITDGIGRVVSESDTLPVTIDLRMQPSGLYFYRIYSKYGLQKSGKISIMH